MVCAAPEDLNRHARGWKRRKGQALNPVPSTRTRARSTGRLEAPAHWPFSFSFCGQIDGDDDDGYGYGGHIRSGGHNGRGHLRRPARRLGSMALDFLSPRTATRLWFMLHCRGYVAIRAFCCSRGLSKHLARRRPCSSHRPIVLRSSK